jgi:signal transduction histidine kinase
MQRQRTFQVQKELQRINEELEIKINQEVALSREKDKMMFQQRKMASMGEMIENIAHQWRQPLSQVNASVFLIDNIIYSKYKADDEIEKELKNIENLTQYMSNTINNFKNFFDHNKEKKLFFLEDVLNSSLLLLRDELDKNCIDIIKDIQENIIYNGYLDEIQQVFLIIFNNARDIFLSKNIKNPTLIIKIYKTDKEIALSICDNGGGIEDAIIDKIFDPYFTTKHKTQGTGLGLYMSKVIIEDSMQGNISVKNSKNGACFSILLPLEKEKS